MAAIFTVIGLALWAYALATQTKPEPKAASSAAGSGLVTGLDGRAVNAADAESDAPGRSRLVDSMGPVLSKLGVSFMGGFLIAMLMRKFVKLSLLLGGLLGAAIVAGQWSGLVELPWDSMKASLSDGLTWARGQADSAREVISGYLPSTAAVVIGGFFGFRNG